MSDKGNHGNKNMGHGPPHTERITRRTIRQWVREGHKFAMLTCYDATTAAWLWKGGVRCMLVGDTAAQVILGYDSTLPARMPLMLELTAAVRRGAPDVFLMADMPFGSYQCGDNEAVKNATLFLTDGTADAIKMEVDSSFGPLVERMAHAGIPVVAHLGSRPQQVRVQGGFLSAGRSKDEADAIVATAEMMVRAGATMLLLEAVPEEVSQRVVKMATSIRGAPGRSAPVPVIGCGAGSSCHGHVVVLQDLLGMTPWQPPFAPVMAHVGEDIRKAAAGWVELVASGKYLKEGHPYKMKG